MTQTTSELLATQPQELSPAEREERARIAREENSARLMARCNERITRCLESGSRRTLSQ